MSYKLLGAILFLHDTHLGKYLYKNVKKYPCVKVERACIMRVLGLLLVLLKVSMKQNRNKKTRINQK